MAHLTGKDVIETAEVNRNTYYYYFEDTYDLLHQVLLKKLDDFSNATEKYDTFYEEYVRFARFFWKIRKQCLIFIIRKIENFPNPEQREFMYRRIREIRSTKTIFTMDFQNDGEYVGGCIAGGRRYLHINANGDVDPCVFIHYSDSNYAHVRCRKIRKFCENL